MSVFNLQPILIGKRIKLRPVQEQDFEGLYEAASDPEIWVQHPQSNRYERDVFVKFFDGALASRGALAIVDLASDKIIGSSRYYDLSESGNHVTIGYTFLSRKYWGGAFNRELKELMIGHALQSVEFVLFEIGESNYRSRKAIEKIGAELLRHETLDQKSHVVYKFSKDKFKDLLSLDSVKDH